MSNSYIFQAAIDHCRWKSVLRNEILTKIELQEENLHQYTDKNFNEILLSVYNICNKVKGIGMMI
jgi:hypothetical protein